MEVRSNTILIWQTSSSTESSKKESPKDIINFFEIPFPEQIIKIIPNMHVFKLRILIINT